MDQGGWHDYDYRARLEATFWDELWAAACFEEDWNRREEVRRIAEAAAMIGAVLRYASARNTDGSPSEVVTTKMQDYLNGWFADQIELS